VAEAFIGQSGRKPALLVKKPGGGKWRQPAVTVLRAFAGPFAANLCVRTFGIEDSMISHEHKALFIHIPRTGGTSVEKAFGIDNLWQSSPEEKHLSASQARAFYGKEIWKKYFKFSFVRNPWDRMVSLWKSKYYGIQDSFYDFLLQYRPAPWESQSLCCREILDLELDFIGRYESLGQDYAEICGRIGKEAGALPVLQVSQHDHYSKYYHDETRLIVAWLCRKDVREYSYRFDPRGSLPPLRRFQKAKVLAKYYYQKALSGKESPPAHGFDE
jgi:hypothetical protein